MLLDFLGDCVFWQVILRGPLGGTWTKSWRTCYYLATRCNKSEESFVGSASVQKKFLSLYSKAVCFLDIVGAITRKRKDDSSIWLDPSWRQRWLIFLLLLVDHTKLLLSSLQPKIKTKVKRKKPSFMTRTLIRTCSVYPPVIISVHNWFLLALKNWMWKVYFGL